VYTFSLNKTTGSAVVFYGLKSLTCLFDIEWQISVEQFDLWLKIQGISRYNA
jgi:hypothetical protein